MGPTLLGDAVSKLETFAAAGASARATLAAKTTGDARVAAAPVSTAASAMAEGCKALGNTGGTTGAAAAEAAATAAAWGGLMPVWAVCPGTAVCPGSEACPGKELAT